MSEQRPKIEIGYRVGMLTVTERTEKRKSGYTIWRCACDCGGVIELDTRCLQRGTITDCGCMKNVKPGTSDVSGRRYGKLVALEPTEDRGYGGSVVWKCHCDCGNICYVSLHQLQAGYVKSCGCLSHPPLKDFVGKKFGKLTVIEYAGKRAGMHRWKCICECGNETIVGQTLLQTGKTKSCGCLARLPKKDISENIFYKGFLDGTNIGMLEARMTKPPIATNTSGYNGIYKNARGLWIAQITFKKKTYYLGSYSDIQDAVRARKKGEEMFEEFLDWYYNEYLSSREKCEIAE